MEHSFNQWIFIINNPRYDQIKWDRDYGEMLVVNGKEILKIYYKPEILTVIFNGPFYEERRYYGVPVSVFDNLRACNGNVESVFHAEIEGRYDRSCFKRLNGRS